MTEKTAEKHAGKLVLFNHGRNPFFLGKNADGSKRMFEVGQSLECKDQAEYDRLKQYKGVVTTQQVAPALQSHVTNLETQIQQQKEELDTLRKQNEKFVEKEPEEAKPSPKPHKKKGK